MPSSCCSVGCTNRSNTNPELIFYRIPSGKHPFHKNRRQLWLNAIRRENWTESQIQHARLCSTHFVSGKASMDSSSPDFVPTIFNYGTQLNEKTTEQKKTRYIRTLKRRERNDASNIEKSAENKSFPEYQQNEDPTDVPPASCNNEQGTVNDQDAVSQIQFDELSKNYTQLELDYRCLMQEVHTLRTENKELRDQIELNRFSYRTLKKTQSLFTFYTGIQTIQMFEWIVSMLKFSLNKQSGLCVADQILIVIMKLRLGLLTKDIAHRFSLPISVVSKVFRSTLPILAETLRPCIMWPSKEAVRKNMPKPFRRKFRNCRCIIDCTEVFIERPTNLTSRAQTWSNYKHHNTIKYLIGITPAGAISFLSAGWGGRVSDKEITNKSGFLNYVEHGDMIMADRGFLIADELAVLGATLQMPYFTKGKKQLPGHEVDKSRQLANVRIHVERVIGRWKNYRILQSVVPITITDLMDSIVTLCACLTNLSRSVVNKK